MNRRTRSCLFGGAVLFFAALLAFFLLPRSSGAPAMPLSYDLEQVAFANVASGIRLSGTLRLPRGPGPHPAIVLFPGSGEVDRDGTLFGHQFYLVLADHRTRQGFAVLRSDKRGLGHSGGVFATATTYDFAADTGAALAFLRGRPGIDAKRIGLVGHSEGALVGSIVATNIPALTVALAANPRAEVRRLPGLNHFFQTAVSGELDEVEGISETMSPGALALIGTWSRAQVTPTL